MPAGNTDVIAATGTIVATSTIAATGNVVETGTTPQIRHYRPFSSLLSNLTGAIADNQHYRRIHHYRATAPIPSRWRGSPSRVLLAYGRGYIMHELQRDGSHFLFARFLCYASCYEVLALLCGGGDSVRSFLFRLGLSMRFS